jgi:hypothetical protein
MATELDFDMKDAKIVILAKTVSVSSGNIAIDKAEPTITMRVGSVRN